jgi:site-specific DNA-cytosine methylase
MKKKWEDLISKEIGVKPVLINSNLFSGQNRQRLYWTNIDLTDDIIDKGIKLKDILEESVDTKLYLSNDEINKAQFKKSKKSIPRVKNGFEYFFNEGSIAFPNSIEKKSQCLLAAGQGISRTTTYVDTGNGIRKLSPIECERLQNVPDNYTDNVSNSQRYKMLGNGWTVDVIAHIFSQIK